MKVLGEITIEVTPEELRTIRRALSVYVSDRRFRAGQICSSEEHDKYTAQRDKADQLLTALEELPGE